MRKLKLGFILWYKRELERTDYKCITTLNKDCTDKIYIFIKDKLKNNVFAICFEENTTCAEQGKFTCELKRKKIFKDCFGFYIHIYKGKKLYLHDKDFQNDEV